MSVFAADIKTPRAVSDPGTDHILPPSGALSYGGITSLGALSGTSGTVTSLVTGDHNEIFNGNETRTITLDREHTVLGNQTSTVNQDRHDVVQANYNQHITGTTQRFHVGATVENFNDQHSNTHQTPRHLEEPTSLFKQVGEWSENVSKKYSGFWHKLEIVGNKGDVCYGIATELTTIDLEAKGLSLGAFVYANDVSAIKTEEFATEAAVKALEGRVTAVEGRAGATEINVLGVFVTPFALGIYL